MSFEERNRMSVPVQGLIANPCLPIVRFSMLMAVLRRHLHWKQSQTTQPQQIVGGTDEVGMQLHSGNAAKACAPQATPALHPAEDLLDPLALSLTDPVALMSRGASIQPRSVTSLDLRYVRTDATAAQKLHEGLAVIALVRTQTGGLEALASLTLEQLCRGGRLAFQGRAHADVHAQSVAVLHERVSAKAQLGFFALTFARRLSLRITRRGMRVVGAWATAKIHPTTTIRGRRRPVFGLEALLSGPCLDQRPIHRQMIRAQQPLSPCDLHDGIEEALCQILVHQALAQAREVGLVQPRILKTHIQEPAKQNVVVEH